MKRYRDYKIELPDYETAMALLSCVENKATSIGLQVSEQSKGKGTFGDFTAFIISIEGLPKVRLVLSVYKTEGIFALSIVNIVPTQDSGFSSLEKEEYNRILQYFVDSVLNPVNASRSNSDICELISMYCCKDFIYFSFEYSIIRSL